MQETIVPPVRFTDPLRFCVLRAIVGDFLGGREDERRALEYRLEKQSQFGGFDTPQYFTYHHIGGSGIPGSQVFEVVKFFCRTAIALSFIERYSFFDGK